MFQTKILEKIKTRILCPIISLPPPPEYRAVYEIMWKNIVESDMLLMTIRLMRIACWILKAADTDSEYVTGISSLQQQCLQGHISMLCYTYIPCLDNISKWAIRLGLALLHINDVIM